jgi:hypothetical protein
MPAVGDRDTGGTATIAESQAYLDALALCEMESVATLWVHDPLGLFPQRDRPELEL